MKAKLNHLAENLLNKQSNFFLNMLQNIKYLFDVLTYVDLINER